jgi:hypothetical protein
MNITLLKDRGSYGNEPKTMTDFGDILVPDDKDQQNPCSTNLQAGVHETNHVDVDAKHVFALKRAVQPTVPLDSKTHNKEMKSIDTDPASDESDAASDESEAYKNACHLSSL